MAQLRLVRKRRVRLPRGVRDPLSVDLQLSRYRRNSAKRSMEALERSREWLKVADPMGKRHLKPALVAEYEEAIKVFRYWNKDLQSARFMRQWLPVYSQWRVTMSGPRAWARLVRLWGYKLKKKLKK